MLGKTALEICLHPLSPTTLVTHLIEWYKGLDRRGCSSCPCSDGELPQNSVYSFLVVECRTNIEPSDAVREMQAQAFNSLHAITS
jgi:hypothetical protein